MKDDINLEVSLTEGVSGTLNNGLLALKGPFGEVSRQFTIPSVQLGLDKDKVVISVKKGTKRDKAFAFTTRAHIRNMMKGVLEGHKYLLKVCSGHFPMKVEVSGNEVIIKNFLGESKPRKVTLLDSVKVTIEGDFISVVSTDREKAGQMAANIEQLTVIKGRDWRIFQDGVYITEKSGKRLVG